MLTSTRDNTQSSHSHHALYSVYRAVPAATERPVATAPWTSLRQCSIQITFHCCKPHYANKSYHVTAQLYLCKLRWYCLAKKKKKVCNLQWGQKVSYRLCQSHFKNMREVCTFHHRYTSTERQCGENQGNHIVWFVCIFFCKIDIWTIRKVN